MYMSIIDCNKRDSAKFLPQIEEVLDNTIISITDEDRELLNRMKNLCINECGISFEQWKLLDKYQKMIHPPAPQKPQLSEFRQQWSESILKTARGIYWFVMVFSIIFVDRVWIWIIATIVYICYIEYHKKNLKE